MEITSISLDKKLHVQWQNGESSVFTYFWLRDNARDSHSFDQRSHQRLIFTAEIDPNIQPDRAMLAKDGDTVTLRWPNGDISIYSSDFLNRYQQPAPSATDHPPPTLWQGQLSAEKIDFDSIVQDHSLPRLLYRQGFALITNCPRNTSSVAQIVRQLGYVRNSIFGGIWTFEADHAMDDSAYSSGLLRPHTDGTYCFDPPGAQILLCLSKDGAGGESILVDGFAIAQALKEQALLVYDTLCSTPIESTYCGDGKLLKASHPVFREAQGELKQVCFNNYDRDIMCLNETDMTALYHGIQKVDTLFNDPARQWRHTLQPGEALVFDNWRLLHGRTAYTEQRQLTGCYLNHEDLESRWRMLNRLADL